jgi:hypothetical protein
MPLSWDIYTHINYALAYLHDGFTNLDYLLNAPVGKTIGYPPVFHVILMVLSSIPGMTMIGAARLLQVILPLANVLTVCYVAYKLIDEKAAFFAGILFISSLMFTRVILPIPESLAMIFFTLSVYSYYAASKQSNYKYSLLAALLSLLTLATHFSSFVYLMLLLFVLMLVQTALLRNLDGILYYAYVVIPIFIIGILSLGILFVISPSYLTQVLSGLLSIVNDPLNLFMGQIAMGLERYIKCVGIVLVFAIIGLYYSFKDRKHLFISLWALIAFVITNLHWFGIPVYTFRLLIYLMIPSVILGGYAISAFLDVLESENKKLVIIISLALIILSFGLGVMHINDSSVLNYNATTEFSSYQIAPPTSDEIEVINWFENEEHNNKSVLTNNLFFGTVLSSIDEIPIHYGFDVYTNKSLTKSSSDSLNKEKIGYIVYDKSLIIENTTDNELDVRYVNGSYYPTYYFTKEITENNFNTIQLQSSEKVFENNRFIICKII